MLAVVALLLGAMVTHANAPVQAKALAEVTLAAAQSLAVLGDRQTLRMAQDGERQKSGGGDSDPLLCPAALPPRSASQGLSPVPVGRTLRLTLHAVRPFSQAPPHLV